MHRGVYLAPSRLGELARSRASAPRRSQTLSSSERYSRLLTRFARVRPREGELERNWRAFQSQARLVLGQ